MEEIGGGKDYISGCVNFSFNCQSVSLLQAYLLLELSSSRLLARTGGNQRPAATGPLVFSGNRVHFHRARLQELHLMSSRVKTPI